MHRKNTARGPKRGQNAPQGEQPWFRPNLKRQRRRNEIAKASRRKNRSRG